MMYMNDVRKYLIANNLPVMILSSECLDVDGDGKTKCIEYRLIMPVGKMDYTTLRRAPKKDFEEDFEKAQADLFEQIHRETLRDTGVDVDCMAAYEIGKQYEKVK